MQTLLIIIKSKNAPRFRCPRCLHHFCSFHHAYRHKEIEHCTGVRSATSYVNVKSSLGQTLEEPNEKDVHRFAEFLCKVTRGENVAKQARERELQACSDNSHENLNSLKTTAHARNVDVVGLFDEAQWPTRPPFSLPEYGHLLVTQSLP